LADQRVDLAEAAQHRRDEQTRKRAVAGGQFSHVRVFFDGVIERPPPTQHCAEEVESDLTCRRFL
jgi:hypothetical protein